MTPFTDQVDQQVQHVGEQALIRHIEEWLGETNPPSPAGMGDDAAVVPTQVGQRILTKDSLVYGKHFDKTASPEEVGGKLLKRNLSDLAAMGALPGQAVLACLLPPMTSLNWLNGFYTGLRNCAKEFNVTIVGGDISSTFQDLAFTLTLLGTGAENSLTRRSAKNGDTLWVTGSLGGSILKKHLQFTPRLKEGAWLATQPSVSSGMDLSDGLATDLHHLCPPNSIFKIDTDTIPISKDAITLSKESGNEAIHHALTDGEDYELLFTLSSEINPIDFANEWRGQFNTNITCIGKVMTPGTEENHPIQYLGSYSPTTEKGYEHFR